MKTQLIDQLNILWQPIYPWLARWIENLYGTPTKGHILEMGPFSGGIISSLLKNPENPAGIMALSETHVAEAIGTAFSNPCPILISPLDHLPLMPTFGLVICRGAFFFLTPDIISETYRILRPGGHALLGGGYGPMTPSEIISPIADESKDLNYQLGKKWLSREALTEMVAKANLQNRSEILTEGGLWLRLSKPV